MDEIDIFDRLRDGDTFSEPLADFISRLEKIRDSIPPERRAMAMVNFRCSGDYASTYADVRY
jgi:hypothetical protein